MLAKFFSYSVIALAIVLVIIIGALAVGYRLGQINNQSFDNQLPIIDLNNRFSLESAEIKTITGQIKAVGDDYLMLNNQKVVINDQTKIWRQRMKNLSEIKDRANGEPPADPFIFETIKEDDLKVGDRVTITADEGIKDKTEFIATIVILKDL